MHYARSMIPVLKPKLPPLVEVSSYIQRMDESRIYSNFGPLTSELEERYARKFGIAATRIVSVANATLAIQGTIAISSATRWLCPDYTFAATAHAILQAGKELYLGEVSDSDWKLNLKSINFYESNLGIVPVMPFGAPVDIGAYSSWSNVVIDAAASLGSTITGLPEMSDQHFVVYSLHATKVLGAGEGSLVICGSENAANELRSWCNFGFFGSRNSRRIGTNAKMSEISAAYGLASFDNYAHEASEWNESLLRKNKLLSQRQTLNISDTYPGFRPYWIYDCLDLDSTKLQKYLSAKGVDSRFWWTGTISSMPAFQGKFKSNGAYTVAHELSTRLLGLPMWRDISNNQLQFVADKIEDFSRINL